MTAVVPIPPVTTQPAAAGVSDQGRPWTTGICGCTEDVKSCCCVLLCGPCYSCKIASNMGENCCIPICVPGALVTMRTKLRTMHNIEGGICSDCIMAQFLGMCVACQLKREMAALGMWRE